MSRADCDWFTLAAEDEEWDFLIAQAHERERWRTMYWVAQWT